MQPLLLISFTFLIFSSMPTLDAGDVPDEAVQSWRNILRRAETGSIQVSNAQWTNGNLKFEDGLLLTQRDGVNIVHERGPLGVAGREGVRPPRVSIRTESAYYGLEKPSEDADWKLVFAEPSEETEDGIVRRIAIYEANLFRSVFVFSGDLATLYDQPNRYEFSAWKIDDLPGPQLGTFQIENLSDDNQFELLKVQVNPAHQYRVEQIDFEWSDESAPSTIKLKYGPFV